jgi:hypothetical protein
MKKFRNWLAHRLATIAKRLKVYEDDSMVCLGDDMDDGSPGYHGVDFNSCSRLTLSIHYLHGGQIVEVSARKGNSRSNQDNNSVHLIGEGTDLSDRIREIVFNETLRIS